jgi:hypothetical protein
MTRMACKRKTEDDGGYPAVKRARLMQLSCASLQDTEESFGLLGNSTSSAHSDLPLNGKGDDKDDDALVLDTDKDLLWEMVELLNELRL